MTRFLCWTFGHRYESEWVGKPCSSDRWHYCRKARLVCRRCRTISTGQGELQLH